MHMTGYEGPIVIDRIDARVWRWPLERPIATSFGEMRDRPMALVRVIDREGAEGWGEMWCNFPPGGAEHRARLVKEVVAPLLLNRAFSGPEEAFRVATNSLRVLVLQTGEPGPLAQAVAGVDQALHDLTARRAGVPLWRHLGGSSDAIPWYASGLGPEGGAQVACEAVNAGACAIKLKVGFGAERDRANLAEMRKAIGSRAGLMIDANQRWSLDEAVAAISSLAVFDLAWIEEPIPADRPAREWAEVAAAAPAPLAAGENLIGEEAFTDALDEGALSIVQPDVGKWGGVTGCLRVAQSALLAGRRYCPHWLGGGVGLLASAHVLAAVGGDGVLEVDVNPNPFREALMGNLLTKRLGRATLGEAAGVGITPDPDAFPELRTL